MSTYRILFLGDIVGKPGRKAVKDGLPSLKNELNPLFTIVNAENSAAGVGFTSDIADDLFRMGIDAITLGNHAFHKRDSYGYLDSGRAIVRPANASPRAPGRGLCFVERENVKLAVANICGRVFMDGYDDPFRTADEMLEQIGTPHVLIDFHAEATSEKTAFAWHMDGRATAVLGTHTHVPTADERVLPGGTAYITDVGMSGPIDSIIGMQREIIIGRFLTGLPARFEVAENSGVISGVAVDVQRETGRAVGIRRVRYGSGY
ncbi:MAG: TIGR00282 family metallophosphoesterase [Armatimonadetes bacterium]|nr:TIGR00282 family metallophosphoesterase [Armatimonadota bacterium]